ncbi:hypothetical protein ABW20_dc0103564 [Dactylellina cionopaga]|nr:hypothetical protein ABW20_dc0103564 [Dactylellina cionopaga]
MNSNLFVALRPVIATLLIITGILSGIALLYLKSVFRGHVRVDHTDDSQRIPSSIRRRQTPEVLNYVSGTSASIKSVHWGKHTVNYI